MKVKFYQAQLPVSGKVRDALRLAEDACRRARELSADFVLLPEMFCCPYETANFPVYAQPERGQIFASCSELAGTYGLYLSAGSMPEKAADGKVYNTAYVFDRKGRQIAKHRKMHLFDIDVKGGQSFRESDTLSAGDSVTVFDTEFGPMGLGICYDLRFPELVRLMALEGAKVILVPAAFNMTTGPMHWELMFRSQAMYSQVFVMGTAPARDMAASYHSWGHTIAVDPWGRVLAQMDEKEGFQLTETDLDLIDEVRDQLPLLRHRRTDVYTLSQNGTDQ